MGKINNTCPLPLGSNSETGLVWGLFSAFMLAVGSRERGRGGLLFVSSPGPEGDGPAKSWVSPCSLWSCLSGPGSPDIEGDETDLGNSKEAGASLTFSLGL